MIRGLYTSASGMLALQRRQETLANNLANINTPGYKSDEGIIRSFPEQLLARIRDQEGPTIDGLPNMGGQPAIIGRLHTGVYMPEALANFKQGDIEQTDSPYDVALTDNLPPIEVDGKMVKQTMLYSVARLDDPQQPATADQVRYSRNGQWSISRDGYMVTADGYYVLDSQNRAIRLEGVLDPAGNPINVGQNLKISSEGELTVMTKDPDTNTDINIPLDPNGPVRLGLKVVADPDQLVREGNNLYRWEGQGEPVAVEGNPDFDGYFAVRQGWVERSNVDASQTMTEMLTALRAYEANQRVMTTIDATLDKAVNEIGRVNG